jgi:16S rRNA (adenine1518-N6/adenine1519-N6)-dimethyltransferase
MTLNLIEEYNIKAKKSLWQNFLVDENILDTIVESNNIKWEDIVEVWPWYWALTLKIINKTPKSLELIELDKNMVNILNNRIQNWDFSNLDNIDFSIKNIDVLNYNTTKQDYIVVANIPYYITSPILRYFIYNIENKPSKMIILMQKDVWEKILKAENIKKPKSSVLSLMIMKKYNAFSIVEVDSNCFIPEPKVDSIVLWFKKHNNYRDLDDKVFLDIIKKGFSNPRKKLFKNLLNAWFDKLKLEEIFWWLKLNWNIRAEDLNIDLWFIFIKKMQE